MSAAALAETIAEALHATGLTWKRRDEGWVAPTGGRLPREVLVTLEEAGVRVQAVLVEWDEIGADERAALGLLLGRADAGLRFARCELTATQARVAALVEAKDVEASLADRVGGVAAGCRLLAREAGALLVPEAARAFLEFQGARGEKRPPAGP